MKKENLEKIKNPIIKKALSKRCADFIFNYGDKESHEDHNDKYSEDKYDDYYDHTDSGIGNEYIERKGYKRNGAGVKKSLAYDDKYSDYDVYSDSDTRTYWETTK